MKLFSIPGLLLFFLVVLLGCSTPKENPESVQYDVTVDDKISMQTKVIDQGNSLIESNEFHRDDIKYRAKILAEEARLNLVELEEALLYNNETVRWAAQDALVTLGPYAVPVLVRVLETGERRAKEHACNALQRIGTPAADAIPALIEAILSESVANYAARALSTVGMGSTLARDGLQEALDKNIRSGKAVEASLKKIEASLQ